MTEMNVLEAVRSTLDEALAADDRVFILGEDVGSVHHTENARCLRACASAPTA